LALLPRFEVAIALRTGGDVDVRVVLGTGGRARLPTDGRVLQGPSAHPIRVQVTSGELRAHTKPPRQLGPFELVDGDATGGRIPDVTPLSGGALFRASRTLSDAVAVLEETHPSALAEAAIVAPVLFAAKTEGDVSHSAGLAEARGAIWLSLPPRPRVVAETLIHEASHLLFHLVEDQTLFVEGDDPPRLKVPWRADLRPARAVLMGVHAWVRILRWLVGLRDGPHAEWAADRERLIADALGAARSVPGAQDGLSEAGVALWDGLYRAVDDLV